MIKLIALDLDRTLLHTDKKLSDYSIEILEKCRERGIRVIFATARPVRAVESYRRLFNPDAAVYHNGAVIHINGRIIKNSIDMELTRNILADIERILPGAKLSVEIDDILYANFDASVYWSGEATRQTDFSDLPETGADKIIVGVSSMDQINAVSSVLPDCVYIEMADNKVGLIVSRNVSKLKGIEYIAQEFGVSLAETAAFGDDFNDIEMLKECGAGVAVANAIPEEKPRLVL